jgi:hypothetical protein
LFELKSLGAQPAADCRKIGVRDTKTLAEGLGCQPVVVFRPAPGLDVMEELRKVGFLGGACAQHHDDMLSGNGGIGSAKIHAGGDVTMDVTIELNTLSVIGGRNDSRPWRCGHSNGRSQR